MDGDMFLTHERTLCRMVGHAPNALRETRRKQANKRMYATRCQTLRGPKGKCRGAQIGSDGLCRGDTFSGSGFENRRWAFAGDPHTRP